MVAEKTNVVRFCDTLPMIASTCSINPSSSILSASSRISQRICDKSRWSFSRWSSVRPGVPITTCTLCRSSLRCCINGCLPKMAAQRIFLNRPIWLKVCCTCSANSRVGVSTRACGCRSVSVTCSQTGMAKAAVLPLPVGALTIRSCPASTAGITACCTSVKSAYPRSVSASDISWLNSCIRQLRSTGSRCIIAAGKCSARQSGWSILQIFCMQGIFPSARNKSDVLGQSQEGKTTRLQNKVAEQQ